MKCLDSLRPPVEKWQLILVANGAPLSEETLALARELTPELDVINLDQVYTPGRTRNEGLKAVRYEWVFLIDDDAYLWPRYFDIALPLLSQERIEVLGGPDAPARGMSNFSHALAIALASPFCTGMTFGRHKSKGKELVKANEENLTSCNLWIRSHLLHEVKFPENYLRTEETALLVDLEKMGAHMFYHPGMVVGHHRRKNLTNLWRPTFFAGYFRSQVIKDKSLKGSAIFWLPSVFVLLHLTAFLNLELFVSLARIYIGLVVMMSLNLCAKRRKMNLFLQVAFLHYYIVFVYGLGFLGQRVGLRANK